MNFICDGNKKYTVLVKNKPYHFGPDHDEFANLVDSLKMGDEDEFIQLVTVGQQLADWASGDFSFVEGVMMYQDEQVNDVIAVRMVRLMRDGFSCNPMMDFVENLYENPSFRSVNELYTFLANRSLVITDDGHFIGYKAVHRHAGSDVINKKTGEVITEGDLVDCRTGNVRNNVGDTPSMPRRLVDDNSGQACGSGFHCGSFDFANAHAGATPMVLVKVHPKNVVSVPTDSGCQKVRVCDYEVVAEYDQEISKEVVDTDDIASYRDFGFPNDEDDGDICFYCASHIDDCQCDEDDDFDDETREY
jgi:hypothetical protein